MTNNIKYILLLCLIMLLPIDALYYTMEVIYSTPRIPFGIIGGLLGIIAGLFVINLKDRMTFYSSVIIAVFILGGILACYTSSYSDESWIRQFLWYIAYFLIGYALYQVRVCKDIKATNLFCLVVVVCAIVTSVVIRDGWAGIDFNYLRPGVAFFLSGAVAMSLTRSVLAEIIIYLSVLVCLTILNGRTWLYLWMIYPVLLSISSIIMNHEKPAIGHITRAVIGIASAVMLLWVPAVPRSLLGNEVINSRIAVNIDHVAQTLTQRISNPRDTSVEPAPTDMKSLNKRITFLGEGLSDITEHPVLGHYNAYIQRSGPGTYIHNILSYWQQYGFIPFISIIILIVLSITVIWSWRDKYKIEVMIPSMFMSLFVASMLTRSFTASELFFAFGLVIGKNAYLKHPDLVSDR